MKLNQYAKEIENIRAMEKMERKHAAAAARANAIGAVSVTVALVTAAALLVYGFANFVR